MEGEGATHNLASVSPSACAASQKSGPVTTQLFLAIRSRQRPAALWSAQPVFVKEVVRQVHAASLILRMPVGAPGLARRHRLAASRAAVRTRSGDPGGSCSARPDQRAASSSPAARKAATSAAVSARAASISSPSDHFLPETEPFPERHAVTGGMGEDGVARAAPGRRRHSPGKPAGGEFRQIEAGAERLAVDRYRRFGHPAPLDGPVHVPGKRRRPSRCGFAGNYQRSLDQITSQKVFFLALPFCDKTMIKLCFW